jgi:hypothetical protein
MWARCRSLISLALSHAAAEQALVTAAQRGAMKYLKGNLSHVRAARIDAAPVGDLKRTLVVVESEELLRGQKRGIAVALRKTIVELRKLERRVMAGRKIAKGALQAKAKKLLGREHLSSFVTTEIGGSDEAPTYVWRVDSARRRELSPPQARAADLFELVRWMPTIAAAMQAPRRARAGAVQRRVKRAKVG